MAAVMLTREIMKFLIGGCSGRELREILFQFSGEMLI
jgi:hypothetical protein